MPKKDDQPMLDRDLNFLELADGGLGMTPENATGYDVFWLWWTKIEEERAKRGPTLLLPAPEANPETCPNCGGTGIETSPVPVFGVSKWPCPRGCPPKAEHC